MSDVITPVPLDLLHGLYKLLGDLARESAMSREVSQHMLKALRDNNSVLDIIRNEHARVDRLERTLGMSIEENRITIERLEMTIKELKHHAGIQS